MQDTTPMLIVAYISTSCPSIMRAASGVCVIPPPSPRYIQNTSKTHTDRFLSRMISDHVIVIIFFNVQCGSAHDFMKCTVYYVRPCVISMAASGQTQVECAYIYAASRHGTWTPQLYHYYMMRTLPTPWTSPSCMYTHTVHWYNCATSVTHTRS